MQMTDFNGGIRAVQDFGKCDWVDSIKVTSVKQFGFNEMEGNQYLITVKVLPLKGYKGRMFQIRTNSTWLEDEINLSVPIKEAIQSYFDILSI